MYQLIKKYYKMGLYTNDNLAKFVARGTITATQYKELTGGEYRK